MEGQEQAILFDLDGTILDTLTDLHLSVNYALSQAGMPARSVDEVRSFIGNGARKLIEKSVKANATTVETNSVYNTFIDYYGCHSADNTKPYPEISEAIEQLYKQGYSIGVVTNKPHSDAVKLIDKHFGNIFSVVVGQQNGVPAKPNRDMMIVAMEKLGAESAIYIGDSEVDVQFAKNAEAVIIAVTWGFRSKQELIAVGADVIVDNVADMVQEIAKCLDKKSQ